MDFAHALGLNKTPETATEERQKLQLYINLKLASSGQPTCVSMEAADFFGISRDLLKSYREKNRLLANYQCPVDLRIQDFLNLYLADLSPDAIPKLPRQTFVLDRHGVARELSLPSYPVTGSPRAFCTIRPATVVPRKARFMSVKVACRLLATRRRFPKTLLLSCWVLH
jgi:hypothetical protein